MNDSRKLTRRVRGLTAMLLAASLGACTDATGPNDDPSAAKRSGYLTTSAAVLRNVDIDFRAMYPMLLTVVPTVATVADTTVQTFTVNPAEGRIVKFGKDAGHVIAIPANTICDPASTAYGPTEWLKPCARATSQITFTVRTWNDASGRPNSSFSPDVRFDPSAPVPVSLYLQDPTLRKYASIYIPYCDNFNKCVKEEASDKLLTTNVAPSPTGGYWVFRVIRHFSGYNVTAF